MVAFSAFNVTYDIWLVMMTEQVLKKNSKNTIQSLIGIEGERHPNCYYCSFVNALTSKVLHNNAFDRS